jgi:hypothetical protein
MSFLCNKRGSAAGSVKADHPADGVFHRPSGRSGTCVKLNFTPLGTGCCLFITDNQQQLLREKKNSQSQEMRFDVRTVFQCILFTALELKAVSRGA